MRLGAGEVHVWLGGGGAPVAAGEIERLGGCLSTGERERCGRIRGARGRREGAVLARAMVRHTLSRYAAVAPADWRFSAGKHGRPAIANPGIALDFNLSHCRGRIACAVTAGPPPRPEAAQSDRAAVQPDCAARDRAGAVGIDLEYCDPARRYMRLARRYFHPQERRALERLAGDEQREHFYALWTLKEAAAKAKGGTLSAALGGACFALDEDGGGEGRMPGAQGHFWLFEPAPNWRLALARLAPAPAPNWRLAAPPKITLFHANPGCPEFTLAECLPRNQGLLQGDGR